MKSVLVALAAAGALAGAASIADAATIGHIYEGFGSGDAAADASYLQTFGPPGAHGAFISTLVDYGTDASENFTSWLNNAGQNDGSTLTGGIGADQATNFFLTLTGPIQLTAGNHTFSLYSDDGSQLFINGALVVDDNGAHGPTSASGVFDAPTTGSYNLYIGYDECCGGSAVLQAQVDGSTITGGVPEPATWAMMLLGVGMVGTGLRMTRRKDATVLTAA